MHRKTLSGKYIAFKGFYLKKSDNYYLCDFYKLNEEVYRLAIELNGKTIIADFIQGKGGCWRTNDPEVNIELEVEIVAFIAFL